MARPLPARPIALTVGSPTLTAPVMYRYRAPPIQFFNGGIAFTRQLEDPEVWPLNSLKIDPADGEPIKEALHSNYNADMLLECDGHSLVGRSDPERGVAQKINVVDPLILEDRQLHVDLSDIYAALDAITARIDAINTQFEPRFDAIELRLTNIELKIGLRILRANNLAVTSLAITAGVMNNSLFATQGLTISSPVLPTPTLQILIAKNFAVSTKILIQAATMTHT